MYRDIFARRHRHGPGHQSCDARQQNVARLVLAAATRTTRLAVETMPSLAPSTAARNQPIRSVRWRSAWRREATMIQFPDWAARWREDAAQPLLPPKARNAPPITMAPTPAQTGTLTVCLSLTDNSIGPIFASWVSFV